MVKKKVDWRVGFIKIGANLVYGLFISLLLVAVMMFIEKKPFDVVAMENSWAFIVFPALSAIGYLFWAVLFGSW